MLSGAKASQTAPPLGLGPLTEEHFQNRGREGPKQRARDLGSGEGSRPPGNEQWSLVPQPDADTSLSLHSGCRDDDHTVRASMVDITIPTVQIRKLRHRESQSTPTPERGVCWPQLGRGHEATYLDTWVTSFFQPPSRPSMALKGQPRGPRGLPPYLNSRACCPVSEDSLRANRLTPSNPSPGVPGPQGIRPLLSQGQPLQDLNPPCPRKGGTQDLLSLSSFTPGPHRDSRPISGPTISSPRPLCLHL